MPGPLPCDAPLSVSYLAKRKLASLLHHKNFPCDAILSVSHLHNSILLLMQSQAMTLYNAYIAAS